MTPQLTPETRANLKRLAESATRGPWHLDRHFDLDDISIWAPNGDYLANLCETDHESRYSPAFDIKREADARFIELANPATVIALLHDLEAAEERNRIMKEALQLIDMRKEGFNEELEECPRIAYDALKRCEQIASER